MKTYDLDMKRIAGGPLGDLRFIFAGCFGQHRYIGIHSYSIDAEAGGMTNLRVNFILNPNETGEYGVYGQDPETGEFKKIKRIDFEDTTYFELMDDYITVHRKG